MYILHTVVSKVITYSIVAMYTKDVAIYVPNYVAMYNAFGLVVSMHTYIAHEQSYLQMRIINLLFYR